MAESPCHNGNLDGAVAEHRTSIRSQPDNVAAHNNLGLVLGITRDAAARTERDASPIPLLNGNFSSYGIHDSHYNVVNFPQVAGTQVGRYDSEGW